jgi:hypothetical protein
MRLAILLWGAALAAQSHDIPFGGNSSLRPDRFAEYRIDGRRVELKKGGVVFHLGDSGAPPVEIVTPSVSVQPFFAGDYRVEVNRFGESVIVPYGGDLRIVAPAGAQWIVPGQKMIARGSPANPEFRIVNAISRWRRLAMRIGGAVQAASGFSGGGSSDNNSSDNSASASRPTTPAKSEGAHSPPPKPNDSASRSSSPPSRGK